MSIWLDAARGAALLNTGLLAVLLWVWGRNYRRHGATHTLGLLVFGAALFAENVLWVVLYVAVPAFYGWVAGTDASVQAATLGLCGLELVGLVFLVRTELR